MIAAQESNGEFAFTKFKKNKTIYFSPGRNLVVHYFDITDSSTYTTIQQNFHGTLSSLSDTSLILNVDRNHFIINKTDTILKSEILPSIPNASFNRSLPLSKINYIEYEPKATKYLRTASVLSVLCLLALAPVNSYNFSKGTINSETYGSIAGPSLFASVVFPLLYFNFETRKVATKK